MAKITKNIYTIWKMVQKIISFKLQAKERDIEVIISKDLQVTKQAKDIETFELIQRRAPKKAIRNLSYDERYGLDKVNWHYKQTFKEDISVNPETNNTNTYTKPLTKGHKYKMNKENIKDNIRLNF